MLIDRCFRCNACSIRLGDESSSFLAGRNPSIPRNQRVEFVASPNTRWLVGFPISSTMILTLVRGFHALQVGCTTFARFDSNVVQATVWMVERPSSPFPLSFVSPSNRSIATYVTPSSRSSSFSSTRFSRRSRFPSPSLPHRKQGKQPVSIGKRVRFYFSLEPAFDPDGGSFLSGRVRCGCPTVVNHGCESSV